MEQYQIVLYLLSRIVIAFFKVMAEKGLEPFARFEFKGTYPYLAAGVWAAVMYLFEVHHSSLHRSLSLSMDFLYHDSNTWKNVSDFLMPWPTAAVLAGHLILSHMPKSS